MASRADIEMAIEAAAKRTGIDPATLRRMVQIESGGNPNVVTGSYQGALQLSPSEFNKYGGGDIFNPYDNITAGAQKIKVEGSTFEKKYGRPPNPAELYLIHQQGWGGAQAHWDNPGQPAWKSMLSTGEGRQKGEGWARKAIWGNVPDQIKKQYGSVDNLTSGQFADLWARKMGTPAPGPRIANTDAIGDLLTRLDQEGGRPGAQSGPATTQDDPIGRLIEKTDDPIGRFLDRSSSVGQPTPNILASGYGRESGPGQPMPPMPEQSYASAAPPAAAAPTEQGWLSKSLGLSPSMDKGLTGIASAVGAFGKSQSGGDDKQLAELRQRAAQEANAALSEDEQRAQAAMKTVLSRRQRSAFG